MKMSAEHYAYMQEKVSAIKGEIPAHRARLETLPNVKDLERRLLWDVFHALRVYERYTCQQFNYMDAHIETAMRKILKDAGLRP